MEQLAEMRGTAADTISIESCSSIWVFDLEHKRFCRVLKDLEMETMGLTTQWRPFVDLEIHEDEALFIVRLDRAGVRSLRARHHVDPCPHCAVPNDEPLGVDQVLATPA